MKYFTNINTLDELKRAYHRLALQYHPDRGGDNEIMKAINIEHDEFFEELSKRGKAESTGAAGAASRSTEAPEEFRNIVDLLLRMQGLKVELCGSWLWIGGNTYPYRDELKAAGCRWAPKKGLWSWHHVEEGSTYYRGKKSMNEIRSKYGSRLFTSAGEPDYIGAAQ